MFAQEPAQMNLAGGQIDSLALHRGDHKLQNPLVKNNDAAPDMPSDPHLEGQTLILAKQPAFSYSNFVLALME